MLMPKISVIMPVYNTNKEYLAEAVTSILEQTYSDFELLVIDDGSSVTYSDLMDSWNDQRLKYIKLAKNQGAANARNYGLSHAQGEFIAFLDSDDISLPERFNEQLRFFAENPEIDCLGTAMLIIPENKKWCFPKHDLDIKLHLWLKNSAFCLSSVMVRTKIITGNKLLFQSEYEPAEDYAFWLEISKTSKVANLEEVLVKYRWHGNNISIAQATKQNASATKAKMKFLLQPEEFENPEQYNALANLLEYPNKFSSTQLPALELLLPRIITKILAAGVNEDNLKMVLRKFYTRLIRNAPSKALIRQLCCSPLCELLLVGLHRQIFYYLSKGLF